MGGAEVFTHEIAQRWFNAGHEVTLFTSEFPNCKKEEIVDGVKIIRAGGKYSVYWNAYKYYRKYFSKENYNVIIDEINTLPFFTPRFVNKGEKIVALIHQLAREYWFYETPFPISYFGYYFLENKWLRNYVEIPTVTVSESTRQDILGLGFNNVYVVPEGLNFKPLKEISKKEPFPVVIYVGRFKRAKRADHAIKAFRIVKRIMPQAELWVIGSGPAKNDLKKIACEGVKFFSNLNSVDRREKIKRSWILVNPSVREGWGLNVIEANALGVPSVAYDVNGLRDSVKNGKTGLLAKAGDIENLARLTINILENQRLRECLSVNALNFAAEFNWDKTSEELFKIMR
jgi:glycosyltransferase involved in cell wall biosynthesis